jgi:hypothetical protein
MKLERVIDVFDKETDELAYEVGIGNIGLQMLQQIFKPSDIDPNMYLNYEIGEKEANALKGIVDIAYDFTKYSYYLACYSV